MWRVLHWPRLLSLLVNICIHNCVVLQYNTTQLLIQLCLSLYIIQMKSKRMSIYCLQNSVVVMFVGMRSSNLNLHIFIHNYVVL